MKEYIAKEELLKRERDINLANVPFNFIDTCPTVTETDILTNFCKWLKNQTVGLDDNKNQILVVRQDRWVDALKVYLAEMEDKE